MRNMYIITGEYGSGKTEFSVNLALALREKTRRPIYLADLDVINPYFRSREREEFLKKREITIIGNGFEENTGQDIPAVSYGFIQDNHKAVTIIDLAGSENGLKPLGALYDKIDQPELLCVFNLFRPLTDTKEKILEFVDKVNSISRWPVTGLVNNSNLLDYTHASHILAGQEVLLQVSEDRGIPLKVTQLQKELYSSMSSKIRSEEVILFDELKMRETWQ